MLMMKSYTPTFGTTALTDDAGWTTLQNTYSLTISQEQSILTLVSYRTANSEPGSYAPDYLGTSAHCTAIFVFRNARVQGAPHYDIDGDLNSSSAAPVISSVDYPGGAAAVVHLRASAEPVTYSNWTATTPATLTEILEVVDAGTPDMSIGAAWEPVASGATTGSASVDLSAGVRSAGHLISLIEVSNQAPYLYMGTGTFVVPAGAISADVEAWGGGGGGAGNNPNVSVGGGGGGGAYSASTGLSVTPAESITVTVGAAGAGGASGSPGVTGGDSSFRDSGTLLAKGGVHGTVGAGGAGGLAGSGVGTTKFSGGDGASNGGGGGAGSTEDGGDASGVTAGAGGAVGGGAGATGGGSTAASLYGGGGGGAKITGTSAGGAGAGGAVRITLTFDEGGGGGVRVMRLLGNVRFRGVRLLGL